MKVAGPISENFMENIFHFYNFKEREESSVSNWDKLQTYCTLRNETLTAEIRRRPTDGRDNVFKIQTVWKK